MAEAAAAVERAVADTIASGMRTADITEVRMTPATTAEFGDAVAERVAA
jgi:isocitrate dehydrogenase